MTSKALRPAAAASLFCDLLDHEPALNAEVLGHLRGKRLNQRADVERAGEDGHVEAAGDRHVASASHEAHGWSRRHGLDGGSFGSDFAPDIVVEGFAVDELHGEGLDVAVAADLKADLAAGRNLAQHAAQLLGTFDVFAVDGEDDVVDLEADLAGGRVVIDEGDEGAANFLELEGLGFVGIDVGDIDAEIAGNAGVGQQGVGVLQDGRDVMAWAPAACGARSRHAAAASPASARIRCDVENGLER